MSATTIGEALAAKRLDLGLEKGQAAQRIGMSRTTYSSYELDTQRPSVEVFPALAEFLEVSIDDLLTLYGATCIVQARNFLARVADPVANPKTHPADHAEARVESKEVRTSPTTRDEDEAPIASNDDHAETSGTNSGELEEGLASGAESTLVTSRDPDPADAREPAVRTTDSDVQDPKDHVKDSGAKKKKKKNKKKKN